MVGPLVIRTLEAGAQAARFVAPEAAAAVEQAGARLLADAMPSLFTRAGPLGEALPQLLQASESGALRYSSKYLANFHDVVAQNPALAATKVSRVLGVGGDYTIALAAETKAGTEAALKLSPVNMLPRPIPNPAFDAPVLGHGNVADTLHFYMQPIGKTTGVTTDHLAQVTRNIDAQGYLSTDLWPKRLDQIALFGSRQRPLLIDQPCATPYYGSVYDAGRLIPHPVQQANLQAIKDLTAQRPVSLSNVKQVGALRSELSDSALVTPTLHQNWTFAETLYALRALNRGTPGM